MVELPAESNTIAEGLHGAQQVRSKRRRVILSEVCAERMADEHGGERRLGCSQQLAKLVRGRRDVELAGSRLAPT